ncbi:hypothetical protein PQD13_gp52 [Gordonia phage Clawz]|uniref:Uncharacterized protein n=1 Tax=Gordonia phage Clawz TaxID=2743910 RepID=A0AAE7F8V5_9CAUD|nr:hypothetical protein PQD13_gp52 [Gordonia phage Clawz]QKY79964.1 hypothetical protein SEA_CLAWZ_52 [Gordonia phage Clawz]
MSEITIRGLITTTELKRGEEVTIEYTDHIEALIERGYVREVTDQSAKARTVTERVADEEAEKARTELGVPSRSASKAKWQEFLTSKGIEYASDDSKDELIAAWDRHDAGDVETV